MPLFRRPTADAEYRRWWHAPLIIVGLLVPIAWVILARVLVISDGTLILPTPFSAEVEVYQLYLDDSNLREGDRVVAIDGIPVNDWVGDQFAVERQLGDVLQYQVINGDESRDVEVELVPYPIWGAIVTFGFLLLLVVVTCGVAIVVFLGRPWDPAARAILVLGLALPWGITEFPLGIQVIDLAGGPGVGAFVVGELAFCVFWGAFLHLLLVFPEPVGVLRRRPWLAVGCYVLPFVLYAVSFPWKVEMRSAPVDRLFGAVTVTWLAAFVIPTLVVVRSIVAYRNTRDEEMRQRIRWIIGAFVFALAAYLMLIQIPLLVIGRPVVGIEWVMLAFFPLPLAFAAAILRFRLFDIEVILSRSLLVGTITAAIAIAYAVIVMLTPQMPYLEEISTLTALLIGGVVASATFAVRKRLARRVTTVVYGERNDPRAVVERLSKVETATAADQLLPEVVRTLARALRVPYVRLELTGLDGTTEAEAQFGERTTEPSVLLIGAEPEILGTLELDPGPGREQFGPSDRRLLEDLSRHLAEVGRTVMLARALQRSRERIIIAREEERRRVRRDLHDGVGPTLAALSLQLEVASGVLATDPVAARQILDQLRSATRSLITEVRHIVDDLRPAALDELGLVNAIREHAQAFDAGGDRPSGFTVDVVAGPDVGELPAAVEVAAFRITIEAVANAARYSGGKRCTVRIDRHEDLTIEIADDGRGLQTMVHGSGVGLGSMRERASELGGTCHVGNRTDASGTVVRVRLPLHESRRPT